MKLGGSSAVVDPHGEVITKGGSGENLFTWKSASKKQISIQSHAERLR